LVCRPEEELVLKVLKDKYLRRIFTPKRKEEAAK
jgi:hypothetical protein